MIDAMTLQDAAEIFEYWRESPPPYLMIRTIAAMLGWKPEASPDSDRAAPAIDKVPPGLIVVADAGMPAPILDIAVLRARNQARAAEAAARTGKGGT